MQVVDCAKYLAQQCTDTSDSGGSSMVSILSKHQVNSPEISIRVKQVLSSALDEGAYVCGISM